jgi:hypothetical protein
VESRETLMQKYLRLVGPSPAGGAGKPAA